VKVAYYSPLPPERSGIADYSALLLPALRRRMEVEVARRRRPALRRTDVALYHVGNNPQAHGWIVDALRRRPGVVVLHDLVLHHLVAGLTLARGNPSGYIAAMERDDRSVWKRVTPPCEALEDLVFALGVAAIGLQHQGEWREGIALLIRERRVQFIEKSDAIDT